MIIFDNLLLGKGKARDLTVNNGVKITGDPGKKLLCKKEILVEFMWHKQVENWGWHTCSWVEIFGVIRLLSDAGAVAQQLRAQTVFQEDLGPIPSTTWWHMTICNSYPKNSNAFSELHEHCTHMLQRHTHRENNWTYNKDNNIDNSNNRRLEKKDKLKKCLY